MIKKLTYIATALVALTGCSKDYFLGDKSLQERASGLVQPINFDCARNNATRSDILGAEAAALLGNSFRVYGTLTTGGQTSVDFDNYSVAYTGTASEDSTSKTGWTYVGLQSRGATPIVQSVKYWPLNEGTYNFIAFSGIGDSVRILNDSLNTLYVDANNIGRLYGSDRVRVNTKDYSLGHGAVQDYVTNTVTLTFKHLAAKLRIAMYETVEGYAVSNVHFYYDDNYSAEAGTSTKTSAGLHGKFPIAGTYNIYYDKNDTIKVLCSPSSIANGMEFGTLNYVTAESNIIDGGYMKADGSIAATGDKAFLGTTRGEATFALKDAVIDGHLVQNSDWQVMLPFPNNSNELVLRADFDLVPLDGSKSIIKVKGAYATIPVKKAQWKPNFAYTYIFKISDNTKGTTGGPDDPTTKALYPITLDAVVSDASTEEVEKEM